MALATRCPQCGAMFRVVADQLKLRGGLVRCGQCRTVFDAIGSLAYVEDGTLPAGKPGEAAPAAGAPASLPAVASTAAPAAAAPSSAASPPDAAASAAPSAPSSAAASAPAASTAAGVTAKQSATPRETASDATTARAAEQRSAPPQETGNAPARESVRIAPQRPRRAESGTEARAESRAESRSEARARRSRDAVDQQRKALGPATTLRIAPGAAPVATVSQVMPAYVDKRASDEGEQEQFGVPTLLAAGAAATDEEPMLEGIEVIEMPPLPEVPPAPAANEEEPAFIRSTKRRPRRGFSIVFSGGSLLLLLLALAQAAIVFRSELTTRWPQARPAMAKLCDTVGCALGLPTRPDQLAVIASELQAVAGTDVLELTAVIRNRASFTQALPALEVTLSDTQNRALARKVFSPVDYLAAAGEPSSRIDDGLAAGGDLTIRVLFEARGLRPAGFLVYPFYI